MKTNDYVQSTLKTTLDQNKFKLFSTENTLKVLIFVWCFKIVPDNYGSFEKAIHTAKWFLLWGHLSSNLCFLSAKNVGRRIRTQKVQSYRVWTIFLKLRTSFYRYNKNNFFKYEKVRKFNSFYIFVYTYR